MAKKGVPKREILAYAAGIIDGEGWVGIRRSGKHDSGTIRYTMAVVVGNTDRRMLNFMKKYFGGSISKRKTVGNRQPAGAWEVASNKAADFLKLILEFLIVKKAQAESAIKFQGKGRPMRKATEIERQQINYYVLSLRKLNKRGKKVA